MSLLGPISVTYNLTKQDRIHILTIVICQIMSSSSPVFAEWHVILIVLNKKMNILLLKFL